MIKRLSLILCLLLLPVAAWAATEDFSTYTEVDPESKITVTSSRITFVDLTRDASAYVYADKGASHFNGNFTHDFEFQYNGGVLDYGWAGLWGMSNYVEDHTAGLTAGHQSMHVSIYNNTGTREVYLAEFNATTEYYGNLTFTISADTTYYARVKRIDTAGTYGILYLNLYADAANRTAQTNTLGESNVSLHVQTDFRYLYGLSSFDTDVATNIRISGYIENLNINEASPPAATSTQQIIWID